MTLYSSHTDERLLQLLRDSDRVAFTELYNRYWDKLFAVAYNRLSDEPEAEEAVQNVFVSLWQRRETLQLTYSFVTYLSVAVKYQVITRLAQLRRKEQHGAHLAATGTECMDTTIAWLTEKELKREIEACVRALPERCRIVFLMSREKGMSHSEIAKELNIAEKTVEGHITRALHALRASLPVTLPVLLTLLENNFKK